MHEARPGRRAGRELSERVRVFACSWGRGRPSVSLPGVLCSSTETLANLRGCAIEALNLDYVQQLLASGMRQLDELGLASEWARLHSKAQVAPFLHAPSWE